MNFNLLRQAQKVIPYEIILHRAYLSRTTDGLGLYDEEYNPPPGDPPTKLSVKLNAVKTEVYHDFGLDYKKNYYTLHLVPGISGLTRMNSGDLFKYNNLIYQVESSWGWQPIANWDAYLCIEISDDGLFDGF